MAGGWGGSHNGVRIGAFWSGIEVSADGSRARITGAVVKIDRDVNISDSSNKLTISGGAVLDDSWSNLNVSGSGTATIKSVGEQWQTLSYTSHVTATFAASLSSVEYAGSTLSVSQTVSYPLRAVYVPATPTGLTATGSGTSRALFWSIASPSTAPVTSVIVQWSVNGGAWTTIATLGAVTSYTVSVPGNSVVAFRVASKNSSGTSPWSDQASTYTVPAAPTIGSVEKLADGSVRVRWIDQSPYADRFEIRYSNDLGASVAGSVVVSRAAGSSWDHTSPSPLMSWTYSVRALTPDSQLSAWSAWSATVYLPAAPAAPTSLAPSVAPSDDPGVLSWRHSPLDSSPQAGFAIRYRPSGSSAWLTLGLTSLPVTISQAAPAVVTASAETRLRTGDPVRLSSTGTLPAPLAAGVTYYAIRTGSTSVGLALTEASAAAGVAIATTSAGSGSHSLLTPWQASVESSTPLTLGVGSWEWQASTYGGYQVWPQAWSPWSATMATRVAVRPICTIVQPGESVGTASIPYEVAYFGPDSWTSTSVRLVSPDGVVLESSASASGLFATRVADGQTYTVEARVLAASGLWSEWASAQVSVSYLPPSDPVVTVEWSDDATAVLTVVCPDGDDVTTVGTASVEIDRLADGGVWQYMATIPPGGSVSDLTPALLGQQYRVTSVSAIPSTATVVATLADSPDRCSIHFRAGSAYARLLYNPARDRDASPSVDVYGFAGRDPMPVYGTGAARKLNFSGTYFGIDEWLALEAVALAGRPCIVRTPDGQRVAVAISSTSATDTPSRSGVKVSAVRVQDDPLWTRGVVG